MKKIFLFGLLAGASTCFAGPDPRGILELDGYGNSDAVGITAKRGRNDFTIKEKLASGDNLFFIKGYGYNGSAFGTNAAASIEFTANQAWTTTANGTKIVFKTTPDSSVTPATALTINADGSVTSAGTTTVNTLLSVVGSTVAVDVLSVGVTATNDDPTVKTQFARATTTDGVATTIWTITLDANTTYLFEANVIGRRTGGTAGSTGDSAAYKVFGGIVDIAATATPVGAGTSTAITLEDQAGWTAAFAVASNTVLLQVTGATDNNVVWHAEIRYMKVAS